MRAVIASICCYSLAGCTHNAHAAAPSPTATPQHVSVVTSGHGTIRPLRTLSGFIAPLQNVTLSTTLNEPAAHVDVIEGDRVKAGQTLAVFDVSDLQANLHALEQSAVEADANTARQQFQSSQTIGQGVGSASQAKAGLAQTQEKLQEDERDLARYEDLQSKGFIARQTTDQQRTTVASDRAAVRSSQAALQAAQITVNTNGTSREGLQGASITAQRAAADAARAQADQLRAQISRATISSPVEGIVVNRNLNPGEYPNSRTLFTIAQSGIVYAVLNASPAQITGIRRGQAVSIALSAGGRITRSAHVVAVLGQTTPGSTNFTVKAVIDQPDEDLLSGLPLVATITLAEVTGTSVPRAAFTDGTESQVIAVRDHVAHLVPVQVVAENATTAIVRGLASGTVLVSDGNAGIADGDHVDAAR